MRLEALREDHLLSLFEQLNPDRHLLGSVYMDIVLEQWDWFYEDFSDNIQTATGTRYFVIVADEVKGLVELADYGDHVRVGYWLQEKSRGQGIMTKYLTELLATVTKKIVVTVEPHNDPSSRLMQRLGFHNTKTDEQYRYFERN